MSFDKRAFYDVQDKPHSEQAIWILNGFWNDFDEKEAEKVWEYAHKFYEIQMGRCKFYGARSKNNIEDDAPEGKILDQFQSHRFLEHFGETKTATQLRQDLATIDVDRNNRMSITEYLMFKYGKTAEEVITAPQGDPEEVRRAEKALNDTRAQLNDLTEKLSISTHAAVEAKATAAAAAKALTAAIEAARIAGQRATAARAALNASNEAASEAAVALAEQKTADALVRAAYEAVQASVDALNAEQKKYDDEIKKLTARSEDASASVVRRGRAKNELEQLKSKDPLPLARAKITQESALKKASKASKKAARATAKAQEKKEAADAKAAEAATAAAAADAARVESEEAKDDSETKKRHADAAAAAADAAAKEVEAAYQACEEQMAKCEAELEHIKKNAKAHGKIFWMQREMAEIRKYMPTRNR